MALDLPLEVRSALSAVPVGEGWRRVPVESLHVTLAFLGNRESAEPAVAALDGALPAIARLSLGAPVLLPPRRPRVMAVKLDGDLLPLHASVVDRLSSDGLFTPEKRPFLPHVTIARARDRPSRTLPEVPALAFDAPSVSVYSSVLSPKGARYEALATFPLLTAR